MERAEMPAEAPGPGATEPGAPASPGATDALPSRWARWAEPAMLAAVLVGAILPRLWTLRLALARGDVQQWDGDSAYHLKRILYAMAHFPSLLRWDPEMMWPDGAACPWPDGFDYLAAAWGLVAGLGDPHRGLLAVLLFTLLIALLSVWAAMDVARLVVPDGPAKPAAVASAALLTSVAPSSVYLSSVGFLDHHIAELLVALLLAGWSLRRFPGPASTWERSPLVWELAGSLVTILGVWVFAGGVLYLALAAVLVGVAVLDEERPRILGSGAPGLALAAVVSALLALPAVSAHGRTFSYQFPSLLQPLLVGLAAAALALAVVATRLARGPVARAGIVLAAALGVAALAVLGTGAWREIQAGLAGWLLKKDPWISTIQEFQPLDAMAESFLLGLWLSFGAIGVGAPLILLGGAVVTVRTARARGLAFALYTGAFVALTINQVRFGRVGVPLLMIALAAILAAVAHRRRGSERQWGVRVFPALVAIVLLFADPVLRPINKAFGEFPIFMPLALDLKDFAGGERGAGVLTQWDAGHLFSYASGLPTVTNGFGAYLGEGAFREAESIFTGSREALDAYLVRRKLRFVMAGAMTSQLVSVSGRPPFVRAQDAKGAILNLEYMRSFGAAPLVIGGSAIPGAGVRHLEHLLPVSSTPQQPPGLEFPLPSLWLYERVPGARLTGRAPAGARVLATLDFKEQAHAHVWRAFADAGKDGRFELVVPFPSGLRRPKIWSAPRWTLRIEHGPPVAVEVTEAAVRAGETIPVGALPPAVPDAPRTRERGPPGNGRSDDIRHPG